MLVLSVMLQRLLWKRNWEGPTNRLANVLWIRTGALFSWEQCIRPTLLGQCERLLNMTCHECIRVVCIRFLL
jgi:hypothetical protein